MEEIPCYSETGFVFFPQQLVIAYDHETHIATLRQLLWTYRLAALLIELLCTRSV